MKPNAGKIDDAALALLQLAAFTEGGEFTVTRTWKGHAWEVLDRPHQKGLISDPKNKNKSMTLTDLGRRRSEQLFQKLFCD